jgi:hypothetical protein
LDMIHPYPSISHWIALLAAMAVCLAPSASMAGDLSPAPAIGDCSLEDATPAIVVAVNADAFGGVEFLLDDGRRATLAGLDFPHPEPAKLQAMSHWLTGELVFVAPTALDRWGRFPSRLFAAAGSEPSTPLISVGAAAIQAGLARYRPDPAAAACRAPYLAAEAEARAGHAGIWANPDLWPINADRPEAAAVLSLRKGLTLVEGVVRSVGMGSRAVYLNFGPRRAGDFTVVISRRISYNQPDSGFDPDKLIGRRVRVRGLVDSGRGPRVEIAGPEDIELVEAFSAP